MVMKIVGMVIGAIVQGAVGEAKSKGAMQYVMLIMCVYIVLLISIVYICEITWLRFRRNNC